MDTELEAIREENGGTLTPAAVVDWARAHPGSILHAHFDWNVQSAARKHWLWQARQIMARVTIQAADNRPIRAYVSLKSDRQEGGEGYRMLVDVLGNRCQREELVAQALEELREVEARYRKLSELADVWRAIDAHTTRQRG